MYKGVHEFSDGLVFLSEGKALAVTISDSRDLFAKPDADPKDVYKSKPKMVPWGENNDLPIQIVDKIGKSPDASTNMHFNISAGYGEGILPVRKVWDGKKLIIEPVLDNSEINEFLQDNDVQMWLLEMLTDLNYFHNAFAEVILNREDAASRKIVELNHKEAVFSRWGEMDPSGRITSHYYSADWTTGESLVENKNLIYSPVLDPKRAIRDLNTRLGRIPDAKTGKAKPEDLYRYILPVNIPSPGRLYYQKPFWYSIIESGWLDYAIAIPEFKKALMKNQMTIKYIIYLDDKYFTDIFAQEGIIDKEQQKARVRKEYEDINNFLTDTKNTGKSTVAKVRYSPDGKEQRRVQIIPIENPIKGGEYIEDSEEASNILAYGMGIHGSLIGSHGKSKTINGTEARELFIIKQAMLKPVRDRLLRPLYLVKSINKWPADIEFSIPNLELTTLDQGTGSKKVIS